MTRTPGTDRPWRLLVPTSLHDQSIVDRLDATGDFEIHYALPLEHRVMGGGDLGPAVQRQRVEACYRERVGAFDAVGAMPGAPFITAELLDRAPQLLVVYIPSAGTDSIDVPAATGRGVAVVNAAGNNVVPVSEHTVGLMLTLVRKIAESDRRAHRDGQGLHLSQVRPWPGTLRGRTLGLVGCGAIGREVARIAVAGLGMTVLAYDPATVAAPDAVAMIPTLEGLLAAADVVSLHLPLTPGTRHTIGARQLRAMRPGSFLVNTSRGATVDTDALVAALQSGHLAGAGLDVTDPEPLGPGHPLLAMDNVVVTPHIAGLDPTSVRLAYDLVADGLIKARAGEAPPTLVNPEVWPRFLTRWPGRPAGPTTPEESG